MAERTAPGAGGRGRRPRRARAAAKRRGPAATRRRPAATRAPRGAAGRGSRRAATGPSRPARSGKPRPGRPGPSRPGRSRRPVRPTARPAPRAAGRATIRPRRRPARARPPRSDAGRALARARSGRRLAGVLVVYLLLTALIGWRLVDVQLLSAGRYRSLGEAQLQREIEVPASRGRLYDRDGEPLAMSVEAATVYANPPVFDGEDADPGRVAADLAPLLGVSADDLLERLRRDVGFVFLARQVPRGVGEQIRAMRLPGVGVLEEPARTYPAAGLAAQVVGFAGIDNTGLGGLELQYDAVLSGQPGRLWLERAPGGLTITGAPREVHPPVAGTDVVLTIDRELQWATEEALVQAVERFDAAGASAVVLDARSGEVLAMASAPGFDPARAAEADDYARRNRAVTDVFEPGSVNKVVTAAAAVEEGVMRPGQAMTVPESYAVGPKRFRDLHRDGAEDLTLADILSRSSNVGTIMLAERLGDERLHDYLRDFGYGRPTGLGFPGESAGLMAPVERWWRTSLPTIAIGQGVSATLLQVAGVFEVVASGGEWVAPTLVRGTVDPQGRPRRAGDGERRRVVSASTAATVSHMLAGVVDHGTGALAAVPGYAVAGKTGTARKPSQTARGYEQDAYVATFAGFAPADDPAVVVAVMIDDPTPIWGGLTAAPVFSEIMDFTLRHRRIPPSDPGARTAESAAEPGVQAAGTAAETSPDGAATPSPLADLPEAPGR